jgi:hypothetical protein
VTRLACPYLRGNVELSAERERHIRERHPDLLPAHHDQLSEALANPDHVRRSARLANARLFSRWFGKMGDGRHVVVVVVSEDTRRHWVVTAYLARKLTEGAIEWKRS